MLTLFKLILLAAIAVMAYLLFRLRIAVFHRIWIIIMGSMIVVFILIPELSEKTARLFQIGRGVDFIFYLTHVVEIFLIIILYAGLQKARANVTILTRQMAIRDAASPLSKKP